MTLSRKALLLLLAPALLAACTVRELNDGSYTTCRVGNPCQVGPQAAMMRTPGPMMHTPIMHHHHHHMIVMKKRHTVVVKPAMKHVPQKPPRTDDSIHDQ